MNPQPDTSGCGSHETPRPTAEYRRNLNIVWGECCARWLAVLGVRHAVVCPGSRSAPLALGFAHCPDITTTSVLDERSAAFYALGISRASGIPAALICTSGTAAANFLPAVVEARYARIPMLIFTADRPPELRECAAGQAILQNRLYADFVNFQVELALPDADCLPYLRQTLVHAYRRTLIPQAGPVHLNQPFREPLAPVGAQAAAEIPADPVPGVPLPVLSDGADKLNQMLEACADKRGIIIAGSAWNCDQRAHVRGIAWLAKRLQWPVLADVLSPARHRAVEFPCLVSAYHALLGNGAASIPSGLEAVIRIGHLPTSKALRSWLTMHPDSDTWIIDPGQDNTDPLHARSRRLHTLPEQWPGSSGEVKACGQWLTLWRKLEQAAAARRDRFMSGSRDRFEGKIPWLLGRLLPPDSVVILGSSMPVRDAEFFWPANDCAHQLFANRGANGIDGVLSTALGLAASLNKPVHLVIGDLALAHDLGAFKLARNFSGNLRVICVNNNGGGIFENLPIAAFEPPFEALFATPQSIDFSALPAVFGIRHHCADTPEALEELLKHPPGKGIELVEWHTDRKQDTLLRRDILKHIGGH